MVLTADTATDGMTMANVQNKVFSDFRGGLNFVDSELDMNAHFLTEATNVELGYDSTIKKRNGFRCVKNMSEYLGDSPVIYDSMGHVLTEEETDSTVSRKWVADGVEYYSYIDVRTYDDLFVDAELTEAAEDPDGEILYVLSFQERELIAEIFYFQLFLICYTNRGNILLLDDENKVSVLWSPAITNIYYDERVKQRAFELCYNNYMDENPGATRVDAEAYAEEHYQEEQWINLAKNDIGTPWTIWNYPYKRCFGNVFNNMLILSNGYDKPLQICFEDVNVACQYLHDPATGSNVNVPRIYKCVTVNHYLCAICIGDNKLHISAKDVAGLWEDDHDGPDSGATHINVGAVCSLDNQELTDVCVFKNNVGVMNSYFIALFELDNYEDEASTDDTGADITVSRHHPAVTTVVDNAGCITSGSVRSLYDSVAFLSSNGINSIKRNVVSQNFTPDSLSVKVLPYIKERLTAQFIDRGAVSFVDTRKFMYGIRFDDNTMLMMSFHPNLDGGYCFFLWDNIKYVSFTNNVYGRLLSTDGYGIFIYADDDEHFHKDEYIDIKTEQVVKEGFKMTFETPWLSYGRANNVKTMEYINIVASGTANFTLSAKFDLMDSNEVKINMLGYDSQGYGYGYQSRGEGSDPYYGGGIIASNLNLVDFNQSFMYNKFRVESDDDKPLGFIRASVHYKVGGIRR